MRVNEDAFLPGRNLLFLLAGCAYAYAMESSALAIGLLSEADHIFPDQTRQFLERTEDLMSLAMSYPVKIVAPLMGLTKRQVVLLARQKGIDRTYSCHSGTSSPCGECVSCQERLRAEQSEEV